MKFSRCFAGLAAVAALGGAQAAQAAQSQQGCIAPADLGDTVIYALPIAYDAARAACAREFKSEGFMARRGDQFIAGFRKRQNTAWPGAFRTMKVVLSERARSGDLGDLDLIALAQAMPEANLRPFVDGLMGQMIAQEIKPANCAKIERGLELVSPLPVDNIAGLMGFMAELVGLDKPSLCPASLLRKKG